jgi:hypothetical protein
MFWLSMMNQYVTYWATPASAGVIMRARWSPFKTSAAREDEMKGVVGSLITGVELARGGIVALGDFAALSPAAVPGAHTIKQTRQTPDIENEHVMHRAFVAPSFVDFLDTVVVWPLVQVPEGSSFYVERATANVYTGPGRVLFPQPGAEETFRSSQGKRYDVVVTVPRLPQIVALKSVEIVSGGRTIEADVGIIDSNREPLCISFPGFFRAGAVHVG